MSEESRRMLRECGMIFNDQLLVSHIHNNPEGVFQAAVEIMRRVDGVLEKEKLEED